MDFDLDPLRQHGWQEARRTQQEQEEIARLRERWKRYNLPTQERLELLLQNHGIQAAQMATEALERK